MISEIKFKGVTYDDEVVYSKSILHQDKTVFLDCGGVWRTIRPDTIAQYTGFKDVNNKDIYMEDKLITKKAEEIIIKPITGGAAPFKGKRRTNWQVVKESTIKL